MDIKFDYIFKEKYRDVFHHRIFTLEQLEDWEMDVFLLESNWEIVARRQFTGMHDKHLADVYGGDLLQLSKELHGNGYNEDIFVVKWDVQQACWNIINPIGDFVVVGNVVENADLLNKK